MIPVVLGPVACASYHVVELTVEVVARHYVVALKAPRFSDSELIRHEGDGGVLEAWYSAAQTAGLVYNHVTAIGQRGRDFVGVCRIDLAVNPRFASPGNQHTSAAWRVKVEPPAGNGSCFDVRHFEPEPGVHTLKFEPLPGAGEDIAVPCRVDHDFHGDRLTPGLVLNDNGFNRAVFDDRFAGPGLVEDADAGCLEHLVGGVDERVGVEGNRVADAMSLGGRTAPDETPLRVVF